MTEDKFERFVRKAAQSYNAPPVRTPREEMWKAIQSTRQSGPRVIYGGGLSSASTPQPRFGSKVWWSAAAAALLVATGVGIGRMTAPSGSTVAISPVTVEPTSPERAGIDQPASGGEQQVAGGAAIEPSRGGRVSDFPVVARGRSSGGPAPSAGTVAAGSVAPNGAISSSAYQVAAVNHLTQAEALLTSFRTRSATDQRADAQLSSWARELLSNTRLLLDSPLAVDPQRRPLLQDLEVLLVQIVQLSPGSTQQDREIIEQTLKQEQVLTRLRTAIPAGQRGS